MKSILKNIKSKYSLQNVFSYLSYKTSLKLVYGSRYLSQCLNITVESYKKFHEIKKIIKPSYDINRYCSYDTSSGSIISASSITASSISLVSAGMLLAASSSLRCVSSYCFFAL